MYSRLSFTLILTGLLSLTAHALPCNEHSHTSEPWYPSASPYTPTPTPEPWSTVPTPSWSGPAPSEPAHSRTYTHTGTYTARHKHRTTLTKTQTRTLTSIESDWTTATLTWTTTETDTVTVTATDISTELPTPTAYQPSLSSVYTYTTTVSATGTLTPSGTPSSGSSQCNTGPVQCCNSVQPASAPDASNLLGSLGLNLQDDVPVGLTCSPLNVLGIGGAGTCAATPVCCENNTYNGLINIGCVPITL